MVRRVLYERVAHVVHCVLCISWSVGQCVRCVFFFQAEDGIRDLVRSRGLGDVYKRQYEHLFGIRELADRAKRRREEAGRRRVIRGLGLGPVSYTHLTLPTSDLV